MPESVKDFNSLLGGNIKLAQEIVAPKPPNITFLCPMWSEVPTSLLHNSKQELSNLLVTHNSNLTIHILIVGIGKVRSALNLAHYLSHYTPEHLYVLGTCGSLSPEFPIGKVLTPSMIIDVDFFCGELEKAPVFRHTYDRFRDAEAVVFGCTDSFKTTDFGLNAAAVDMESHALCQTAQLFDQPIKIYRVVSDMVGSNKPPMDDALPREVLGELNKLAQNIVYIHTS